MTIAPTKGSAVAREIEHYAQMFLGETGVITCSRHPALDFTSELAEAFWDEVHKPQRCPATESHYALWDAVEERLIELHGWAPTIPSFVENAYYDELTKHDIDWAPAAWQEALNTVSEPCSPDIAPGSECVEFGLPQGSTWLEVFSAAMDSCEEIEGTSHLQQMQKAMREAGLLNDEI